ncbi:cytochrome c biogenesis protein DipZ [Burkholderia glumae]|uniref:Cytochrome c biogenesis protein DipZ n=1 Tax=Burkholderia glumae TaxID=337 RepID=A0AAQ0BS51_BURGL|nr:cytochrome c biogenesis protein DipZ [Burkholderia glumae]ACR31892.1 putative cytochrome c biogenesis protein [Burkholderia glumae BGR1]AJY64408.1 ahpC/TSA family protein [Burkholderia glumae LMG 2196 = ATCC 33617]KHJ59903.1 cytochrome C biogenesis protein [Burkholderia glumae]MCM2484929.1 cytochrome c biogenesis protein DipZ [Burkholderia glumae]MCM2510622.1 cytochrome c biogenesis protein DipZ [Burkholderia glumae]
MLLVILAYLGGVLTIVSPCILPVLPFVFARADRPFVRNGLPLLAGMAVTFAAVATLAAVGGGWIAQANQAGRWLAIAMVGVFGLTLLLPSLAEHMTRPLVALGNRLTGVASTADGEGRSSIGASLLIGVATGLLWAPCAGPILGLVLTGAALRGASVGTTLLLVAYAAGAATSLAAALLVGGRLFAAMKRSLGAGEWIRRGLGAAMLAGVGAIALGLDTGVLAQVSTIATGGLEQSLVNRFAPRGNAMHGAAGGAVANANGPAMTASSAAAGDGPAMMAAGDAMRAAANGAGNHAAAGSGPAMMAAGDAMRAAANGAGADAAAGTAPAANALMSAATRAARRDASMLRVSAPALPVEGTLPPLSGATKWLNSPPLTNASLRGKVVLIDFWTYSCINCLRTLPYVKAWARKYKNDGLVVIGVHAPEFAFERDPGNVKQATRDLGVTYPVAIDNGYAIWRAFNNEYWPAHYFVDAQGRIRYHHFGEGDYLQSERAIQQLLVEAGHPDAAQVPVGIDGPAASGAQAAADDTDMRSPETYVGYARAEHFASPGGQLHDSEHDYAAPAQPGLGQWGLAGSWKVGGEQATLVKPGGRIVYRFHARDLHLVLGPGGGGAPVRFRVTLDGSAPGASHGADVGADGTGTVAGQRLYQLIRQRGPIADHTFSIEFLDPGVQAFAFTFG